MFPRIISIVCFFLFSLVSCGLKTEESNINSLKSRQVQVSKDKMNIIHSSGLENSVENKYSARFIHYIDEKYCSICELKTMYMWDSFIQDHTILNNVEFIFIVYNSKYNKNQIEDAINLNYCEQTIYLDTLGVFLKENSHIPLDKKYHSFLLDKNNNVIVVGNPLYNSKIENLLILVLENIIANDGIYTENH